MSSADIFLKNDALNLLHGKSILMFGDSNMRAIYKDLLWLLEDGNLIPSRCLKLKNEPIHANDVNISRGELTSSRNYIEIRQYSKTCFVQYEFITKLFSDNFVKTITNVVTPIDFIILNSCLWDLTRWGPNGVQQFKDSLKKTFEFLKTHFPNTRIIWTTTLPPSFKARGGFLIEDLNFLKNLLPFQIIEANKYSVDIARECKVDTVDLHFYMQHLIDYRSLDGIHWEPKALRYVTNLLLTHISMCTLKTLPGRMQLLYRYDFKLNGNFVSKNSKRNNHKRKKRTTAGNINRHNNTHQGYNFNSLNMQFVNKANRNTFTHCNPNIGSMSVTITNNLYNQCESIARNIFPCNTS